MSKRTVALTLAMLGCGSSLTAAENKELRDHASQLALCQTHGRLADAGENWKTYDDCVRAAGLRGDGGAR